MERQELEAAYQATHYLCGKLDLRIGQGSPELDELLTGRGLHAWCYLTAANPRSQTLSDEENATRMRALAGALDERGLRWLRGVARAADGGWPDEPSLLVLGLDEAQGRALAQTWQQNTIVCGEVGAPARLVWL